MLLNFFSRGQQPEGIDVILDALFLGYDLRQSTGYPARPLLSADALALALLRIRHDFQR
jgi:hypothetical protein